MSLGPVVALILTPLVYVLALMRLVRLINHDTVLDPIRLLLARPAAAANQAANEADRLGQTVAADLHRSRMRRWQTIGYFLGCPWCVGMWLALGTAWIPLHYSATPCVQYLGVALAASQLVGMLARFSDDEQIEITPA